ncbi:hypothetical protein MTX78_17180 [Hymenobacter tibetensis]|uniref:Uncharacterized protein n=1 Tax=Hymenobacter tibetensis TaxID=497967 RepID=A0ABY4CXX9_9BACT|nr:hypothetical protein [Hymenobacter tibetensis]UOG73844.1 hypothetical protein MTX78_17180 [Hymenobacter tibetensis]
MKKLVVNSFFAVVLGLLFTLAPLAASAQCTMCKTQVEASRTEKDGYDFSGLNKGILYMAAIPYLLMGAVGYFWYRNTHPRSKATSK